jgi:hypothetical protein
VEVIMIETDILKNTNRARGVGYAEVPLFIDNNTEVIPIHKGSPRDLLKYA